MKHRKIIIIEEIFNSITHGICLFFSIFCLVALILIAKTGISIKLFSFIVYGISLLFMYLMSTLYHGLIFTKAKKVFSTLDHCSIFLLIAGTYTPFLLLRLHGRIGVNLLILEWGLAICGILITLFFKNKYKMFSMFLYLFMGWSCIIALKPILSVLSILEISLLIFGGVLYTSGIIFYLWRRLPFNHVIWHLFVSAGSICHFLIIYHL